MLKDWKAARGEYPAAFLDVPELPEYLTWHLLAYLELSASRRTDQGYPLPVPASEILSYCRLFDIEDDLASDLFFFCGRLDDAYCGYICCKDEEKGAWLAEIRKELKEVCDVNS